MKRNLLVTTIFAALALNTTAQTFIGKSALTFPGLLGLGLNNYGLVFKITNLTTLNSVVVYPYSQANGTSGTITISAYNATVSGTALSIGALATSATVSAIGYDTAVQQTVALNFILTPGTYFLTPSAYSGINGLFFDNSGSNLPYPYTAAGDSIIGSSYGGQVYQALYYYFYNWSLNCSSHFTVYPDTIPHNWIAVNQATGTPPLSYLWNWGDGDSSTGANPSHTYSTPGYYNICLSIADSVGCTSTYCDSSTYLYRPSQTMITINATLITNIEEPENNLLNIFPNPLTSSSILQLNAQLKDAEVVIYDIVGKEMLRKKLTGDRMEIDRGSLESGVYFVRLISEEGQWVEKLLVE